MVLTPKLGTDGARHQMNDEETVLDRIYFVGFFFLYYDSFSVTSLEIIYIYP